MRILIVTGEYPEMIGGVADHSARLASALATAGATPEVLTVADPRVSTDGPIAVRPVMRGWGRADLGSFADGVAAARPDAVLFQWVPFLYGRRGLNPAMPLYLSRLRELRVPVVMICHEPYNFVGAGRRRLLRLAQRSLLRLLARSSAFVVVTTEARRRILQADGFSFGKLRVVRVGANIPARGGPLPARLARSEPGFRIVVFGSLNVERRRLDAVLRAVSELSTAHPEAGVELLLLGPYHDDTAAAVAAERERSPGARIALTGALPLSELAAALASCDVAVLPDLHELGGISSRSGTCAAALQHGLPVVSNRGADTDAIFVDGENYLRAEPDAPGLRGALERLLSDRALAARLRAGARLLHERELAWPLLAASIKGLCEEAALPRR